MTNLNPDGPGSFKAAVERKGARVLVFEVGGVIDLGRSTLSRSTVIGIVGLPPRLPTYSVAIRSTAAVASLPDTGVALGQDRRGEFRLPFGLLGPCLTTVRPAGPLRPSYFDELGWAFFDRET